MTWIHGVALAAIIGVALWVRVAGIDFGAPASGCRPDEEIALRESLLLLEGSPAIKFFNYPPGMMILDAVWIRAGQMLNLLDDEGLASYATDPMPFHIAVRWLSAIFGVATVLLTFFIGQRYFEPLTGLLAAAVLSLAPLHLLHSHFGTLDVAGTFFITLAIYFATPDGRRAPTILRLCLSAFAAGVAAGVKYPFGIVLVVPVLSVVAQVSSFRHPLRLWCVLGVVALTGFLLLAPTFLLQLEEAIEGIKDEAGAQKFGRDHWTTTMSPLLYHLERSLVQGSGVTIFFAFIAGLAVAFARRRLTLNLLVPSGVIYVLHGVTGNVFQRYMVPLYPVMALFAGLLLATILRRWRLSGIIVLIIAAALPVYRTVGVLGALRAKDTRGELLEAFGDGRLPESAIVLTPMYPFLAFPFASMTQVVERPPSFDETDVFARNVDAAITRIMNYRSSGRQPLDVIQYTEESFAKLLFGQEGKDVFVVVPKTFARWSAVEFGQLELLERWQVEGSIDYERVLRIDPTGGKGFPPTDRYDPRDFWFIPVDDPGIVPRPGPLIDVVRVSVHAKD